MISKKIMDNSDEKTDSDSEKTRVTDPSASWWVRRGDLKRLVEAFDFVFTFNKDELERFKNLLTDTFHEK